MLEVDSDVFFGSRGSTPSEDGLVWLSALGEVLETLIERCLVEMLWAPNEEVLGEVAWDRLGERADALRCAERT